MRYLLLLLLFILILSCKTNHDFYTSKSAAVEKKLQDNGCGCFAQTVKDHIFYDNRKQLYVLGLQAYHKITGGDKIYKDCFYSLSKSEIISLFGPPQVDEGNTMQYINHVAASGRLLFTWYIEFDDKKNVVSTFYNVQSAKIDKEKYKHLRKKISHEEIYFADESKLRLVQGVYEPFDKRILWKYFQPAKFITTNKPLYKNDTIPYICLMCIQYYQQNWYRNTRTGIYVKNKIDPDIMIFISNSMDHKLRSECIQYFKSHSRDKKLSQKIYGKPDFVTLDSDTLLYFKYAVTKRDSVFSALALYETDSLNKEWGINWFWKVDKSILPKYECDEDEDAP